MLCTVFALVQVFQQGGVSRGLHVVYVYFFGFKTGKYEIKA